MIRFLTDWSETSDGFLLSYSFYPLQSTSDTEHDDLHQGEVAGNKYISNVLKNRPLIIPCGRNSTLNPIFTEPNMFSSYPWIATIKVRL